MSRVEKIEEQVAALSERELAQFRAWFAEFDWHVWDKQLESDVAAGRLDKLIDQALADDAAGNSTPL